MRTMRFRDFLPESHHTYTAEEVIRHIQETTPSFSDVPDYFIEKVKKSGSTFRLRRVKILELLRDDKALRDYAVSGEERYGEGEEQEAMPPREELFTPIVIFQGEVIDGYSRTATLYREGAEEIDAYVSE